MAAAWTHGFTYDPRQPWLSITCAALMEPSVAGIWRLIPSLTGDVCDLDELRTGERREGAFAIVPGVMLTLASSPDTR